GFYAVFRILPEEELALAVLTNRNAGPFTPAPVALADMVESHFLGEGVEAPRAWGRWIHMALLAMVLLDLVRTVRLVRRWGSLGRPGALARSPGVILRLVFDLVVVVAVPIWILRGFARITLRGMWEFYPDLALALVLVPALGIPAGILRALVASRSDDAGDASGQDSPPSSPDPSSPGTARATA
ncbi:MAG TPA: hypothetical protein VLL48_04715, partial [Longimicrobiales bacterium]|nr:hypothetical protein [Longimicrobiales bacterium]